MVAFAYPDENAERRILGHLPAWRSPADQKKAEQIERDACGEHITSYTVPELTARLRRDDHLPVDIAVRTVRDGDEPRALDEEFVAAELAKLQQRGLATSDDDHWAMTEQGFEALTTDQEA